MKTLKKRTVAWTLSLSAVLCVVVGLYLISFGGSIRPSRGERIYRARKGAGYNKNRFGVYIPGRYFESDGLPLVVAAHGANSDGVDEIRQWGDLAEKHGFIVIAPSYACATNIASDNDEKRRQIAVEKEMLGEILENAFANLRIDGRHVLHTGFSGGGAATWYVATCFPEYFTAFCLRSANFYGRDFSPIEHLVTWRDIPVYILWSRNDHEVIVGRGFNTAIGEGMEALRFMESKKFSRLESKVFESGGHAPRREEAAIWFDKLNNADNAKEE
ncbi:MAG: dienelactone hydrolase family protein [Victivallales bacterium]|nr:dienelactone hydrolase family protein [Victivallales bacterium]